MFQTPEEGNRVAIIAESPTEASLELDMPLVGETGLTLCRMFEKLKSKSPRKYADFCLRRVLLINASHQKIGGRLEPLGDYEYELIRMLLARAKIVICVGSVARDLYAELRTDLKSKPEVEIELCHFGARGIASLSKWHSKQNGSKIVPVSKRIDVMVDWVDECYREGGHHSIGSFEDYYSWRIERLLPPN